MKSYIHPVLPSASKILLLIAAAGLILLGVLAVGAEDEQPTTGDVIGQIEASARVLVGHQTSITHLRFSPDGALLASSDGYGTVRLWDWREGSSFNWIRVHTGPAMNVAFSPDSRIVASASIDTSVRLWTYGDDLRLDSIYFDEPLLSVRFSPDGNWLAVGGRDGTLFLLDITESPSRPVLAATLTGHRWEKGITAMAFSPDGTTLASSSFDGSVKLWDLTTYEERLTLEPDAPGIISQMDVFFSPDGAHLFSSDGINGGAFVRMWDVATGEQVAAFPSDGPTNCIALSPDGRTLASAIRGMDSGLPGIVQLWDIASGEQIAVLRGHGRGSLKGLAFSPDGGTLASAGEDDTIRLWNVGLLLRPQPLQPTSTPVSTPERDPLLADDSG